MKKLILILSLGMLSLGAFAGSAAAESTCQAAHQKALNKCRAYEAQTSASVLENLSYETRVRAAQTEKTRTLYMGRACAVAQDHCARTCASSIETALLKGGDWGRAADLTTDCREGSVAQHRRQMAKRYRTLKSMTFPSVVQTEGKGVMSVDVLGTN